MLQENIICAYTRFEAQCVLFNRSQTVVGSRLKTLKGSKVERYTKWGLGKLMCNKLYFHKCYLEQVLGNDMEALWLYTFADSKIEHDFNIIRWDAKSKEIALEEVPNFDTEREPVVGRVFVVNKNKIKGEGKFHNSILHHKWTMVDNNYVEFDVAESWEWSRKWLNRLTETANGSSKEAWMGQLKKFNLQ